MRVYVTGTDWVFDGTQPGADEETPPNPVNLYGVLKVASELVALERARNAAVGRVAGVSGVHWARPDAAHVQDPGFGHLAPAIVDRLERGEPFTLWESESINMVATPSLASECAEMLLRIVERDLRGTFHCCGGEAVTRSDLARATAEVFELDPDLVRSGPPDPRALPPGRIPRDSSLDARATAAALDYELPSLRELLRDLRRQRQSGQVRPLAAS